MCRGSPVLCLQTLIDAGVEEKKITFLNVISCPEGIATLFEAYPSEWLANSCECYAFANVTDNVRCSSLAIADVKIVTAGLDCGLNSQKYILPGLGDYGDRYYNTVE